MIIDLEHHYYLWEQVPEQLRSSGKFKRFWGPDGEMHLLTPDAGSRVERHLEFMDAVGIDVAVLVGSGDARTLEQIKRWNDSCAQVVREYPKRFVGFAAAQPMGGEPAFQELDRAVKDLGMKGVQIRTRIQGRALDSRDLWPFYEKVSELDIPIDVHITANPPGFDGLQSTYALHYNLAREFDMSASVLRVCFGGVLEHFPGLKFIMNHFGGGVSAVKDRIDYYARVSGADFWQNRDQALSRPWTDYFDRLYFNMAGREVGIATVKCALTNISPKKLMFGSDWPPNYEDDPQGAKRYIDEIKKLDLPKDDIDAMLGGNAAKLLGL